MTQLLLDILSSPNFNKPNLSSTTLKIRLELRLILSIKRTRVLELKPSSTESTFFSSNKMLRLLRSETRLLS